MHDAVNGGRGSHRILEDLVPLREHEVGGDHDALAFVAFSQQGEQHFHLSAVVLYVADVVEYQTFDAIEPAQLPRQPQIALGFQQPLDQRGHRRKQYRVPEPRESVPKRRDHMSLAGPGMSEHAQVGRAFEEVLECPRNLGPEVC